MPTAIVQRRQVRAFTPEPIPTDTLVTLLNLTLAAPSSWNLQDRSVVLVWEPAQKAKLAEAAFGQKQIIEAPATFVFVADAAKWKEDRTLVNESARTNEAWTDAFIRWFDAEMRAFQENLETHCKTREHAVKDAVIAATHLVLDAESLGLATSIMNGWDEAKVKEVIGIADQPHLSIALLVAVGHKAQTPGNPGRLPSNLVAFAERYGEPLEDPAA